MRVELFVSCLVDQVWPEVGKATVLVLERAGCEVHFDPRQTCCSQPAFNSGHRTEARSVASHFLDVYGDAEAIVVPSGSCTAMIRHLPQLFEHDEARRAVALGIAERVHELSSFLVNELDTVDLGACYEGRVTWHDACHGLRELGIRDEPRKLLNRVQGLELVELDAAESCCGFGGTFSVKYPEISTAILDRKLEELPDRRVDALVSGDVSCLTQIGGRLMQTGSSVRTLHLAEVLASR